MAKRRSNGDGGGMHGDAERSPRRYACAETACEAHGTAGEMLNISCDPTKITRDELLRRIRCSDCAAKLPDNVRTFQLSRTLGSMRKHRYSRRRNESATEESAYLRWVEHGQKERLIREYAEIYGALGMYGDPNAAKMMGIVFPQPVVDEHDTHLCGLPIGCCDKRSPAVRYLSVMGEIVGICRTASAIFFDVRNAHRDEADYRKLLSTDDISQARWYAKKWLRGGR